jgi:cellulose synthase/poly-beta-1,6-N-acetylglucosamine synthase-like glycosyltransferase
MNELILTVYIISLTAILIFSGHAVIMLYLTWKGLNVRENKSETLDYYPRVTIQLPVYNEMYVVERLIDAVCRIEYPRELLEIQVLDDSTDSTTEIIESKISEKRSEGFNILHLKRADRSGYKAGALKEGLKLAEGEFIAIFDADFVPRPDFLKVTLPCFKDKKAGMVQSRWEHLNKEYSLLTKLQAAALDAHFLIDQEVKNRSGYYITFNGTAGIWRKQCIMEAGSWQDDTLAEDLDLSIRAQLKGWKFLFLNNYTTPGELPADIGGLKAQQFRWTKGAVQNAKKLLPQVWKSDNKLDLKIVTSYHLLNNFVFPFILILALLNVPVLFLKTTGYYDPVFNIMAIFIIAFISTLLYFLKAQKSMNKKWHEKINLYIMFLAGTMGLAVSNTRAVIEGLLNFRSEFKRTPKYKLTSGKDSYKSNRYFLNGRLDRGVFIELFLALYCGIGVSMAIKYFELAALPFHLLFFIGFSLVSILSLKDWLITVSK